MFSLEQVASKQAPIQIDDKFYGYPEILNLIFFSGAVFSLKLILN